MGQVEVCRKYFVVGSPCSLKSLRKIVMTRFGHDLRQLMLCDNMSVVLAFSRFRSSKSIVLIQIRKFAAYGLARNVLTRVRWIPSELNFSDKPSRLFDDAESKLLVDKVDDSWVRTTNIWNHFPPRAMPKTRYRTLMVEIAG